MSSIINPLVSLSLELGQRLNIRFTDPTGHLATCPFCHKGQMAFYPDPLTLGRRFVATCCHRSGDLFDLVGRLQNVSREAAIQYVKAQFSPLFDFYQQAAPVRTKYEAGRQKIETIWRAGLPPTEAAGLKTFEHFISHLPAVFSQVLGWHRDNLNVQYRWLTRVRYMAAMATRYTKGELEWPAGVEALLVSYLFEFADRPSGLIYQWIDDSAVYRQQVHRIDEDTRDPGLSIHPTQASGQMPLVVCTDARQQLVATFHAANFGGMLPNRFVTAFDLPGLRSQSVMPLRRRPVTFWVNRLTPYVLRAAIRLNAGITTYGYRNGEFGADCLDDLNSGRLAEDLIRRAVTWQSCLADMSRETTPHAIAELIGAAELSPDETLRVKNYLEEPVTRLLSGSKSLCPPVSVSGKFGVVEQTPDGWKLYHRGTEELICNRSWRIAEIAAIEQSPGKSVLHYTLEFYQAGQWRSCIVDEAKLRRRPLDTLIAACTEIGLPPITIDPNWVAKAVHIAMQLAPPPAPTRVAQIGFELSSGLLRTNSCEISLLNGETCRRPATALSLCLRFGDGELPGQRAANQLANNPLACRLISGVLMQLLAVAIGKREPAVVTHRPVGQLAARLLYQLGFTNDTAAIRFDLSPLDRTISGTNACRQFAAGGLSWGTGKADLAYWLAGERPVIWISQKVDNVPLELSDVELQRTVVNLLGSTLRHMSFGKLIRKSIMTSWQDLFKQYEAVPVGDTCSAPLLPRHAVGYWISRGLLSGDIHFLRSRPRGPKPPCWFDSETQSFWIAKPCIQNMLQQAGYPHWNFDYLMSSRSAESLNCSTRSWQATSYLQFPNSYLTRRAIAKLSDHQKA